MKLLSTSLLTLLLVPAQPRTQSTVELREVDRVRIAEAFLLGDALKDEIWEDWDAAPFAVLLVDGEHELLVRHPRPTGDFVRVEGAEVLGHPVWARARKHAPGLLAAFPAVGGVSTIVCGRAENTMAQSSTPWVVTLLHEHFHQLQTSQPDYYERVDALDLANGDESGMWMLNYPFPYDEPEVEASFASLGAALAAALRSLEDGDFDARLAAYLEAKKGFLTLLEPHDARYFSFQVWQEGVARYTQYRVAELAAAGYRPSPEFAALPDYRSYAEEARKLLEGMEQELVSVRLRDAQRTAFYAVGGAEGLLLDRAVPDWRERYFAQPFSLDALFESRE